VKNPALKKPLALTPLVRIYARRNATELVSNTPTIA